MTPTTDNFKHGEEGTHYCCNARSKKEGGKARCCECVPHKGCEYNVPTTDNLDDKVEKGLDKLKERKGVFEKLESVDNWEELQIILSKYLGIEGSDYLESEKDLPRLARTPLPPKEEVEEIKQFIHSILSTQKEKWQNEVEEKVSKLEQIRCDEMIDKLKHDHEILVNTILETKKQENQPPMGVSQWKEYGKKYKYWEYFEKEVKQALIDRLRGEVEEFRQKIVEQYKKTPTGCGGSFGEILCWEIHSNNQTFKDLAKKWKISLPFLGLIIKDHCEKL